MRVYIGIDPRQPVAYNVLQWSITRRASKPVAIIPLVLPQLPITRRGLTDFTYSRYLCPALCGYQGVSVFMDADMLVLNDINQISECLNGNHAVYVRKSEHRFEWPSLMVFNNSQCQKLTKEYINDESTNPQSFEWADSVGELPTEWNFTVGYDAVTPRSPCLVHYTAGIPHHPETRQCDYATEWWNEYASMIGNCSWLELMGDSVHAEMVINDIQERKNKWQSRTIAN